MGISGLESLVLIRIVVGEREGLAFKFVSELRSLLEC